MEANSSSSICFDAENVKNDPEFGFNERVHVKEEVVECLKEEAAWEESAAEGEAAALASLYAGHEVKDELVLGREGPQPQDVAFTLYGASAPARGGCHRDHTYAKTECPPEEPFRMNAGQRMPSSVLTIGPDVTPLTKGEGLAPNTSVASVHVKEEVVECLKEEAAWEESAAEGEAAALASLYAGHEVKDELVLGPEGPQPQDVAFTLYGASAPARGGCHRDHTYAKTECPPEVHVKQEVGSWLVSEAAWEDSAAVGEAAALASLYAGHEVKDELVLGPEGPQPQHVAFTLYACQASAQPGLRECVDLGAATRRLETHVANNADVGNHVHSYADIHTEKQTYACDICKKGFALKTQLMEHVMIHIHQEPQQEEIRVADNARAPDAREHPALRDCAVRLERLELVDLEAGRDERLASRAGRDTDIEKVDTSTEEETYICDTCNERFPLKSQLVDHVMIHIHRSAERQESRRGVAGDARGGRGEGRGPTRAQDDTHACRICHKNFPTPSRLKRHERTHTGERPFSCGICKRKFAQSSHLKTHEQIHTGERPFSCGICKQKFTRSSHLKTHEQIHTREKLFSCGICKQKFTRSSYLKTHEHERIHTGGRPFSCGICKQKFTRSSHLKTHEQIHTGERPFSCGVCKQKFAQLSNLKKHQRTHTGERPFSCGICKKKFALLSTLKIHQRTHTGERPFSCGICKRKFAQSSNLKTHERTHTGERPFSCGICERKFAHLSSLKTHERIHTGERPPI